MKILIVDDSGTMQKLIEKIVRDIGYSDVSACGSAAEALALVGESRPDVILLDWHMPGMNGLELLQRLKGEEGTKHIPVVMLTAEGGEGNIGLAIDSGAEGYIMKPVNREVLQTRLADIDSSHTLGLRR